MPRVQVGRPVRVGYRRVMRRRSGVHQPGANSAPKQKQSSPHALTPSCPARYHKSMSESPGRRTELSWGALSDALKAAPRVLFETLRFGGGNAGCRDHRGR